MTNETNPGTVEACPFCDAAMSHCSDKDGEFWMHPGTVTDGDCFMSGQGIFLRQLTAWNTRAAQSQPAATVQEAIDFKYWLMDAARILRSNGTDTHASWVEKALAALSPSKAVEPAPEQGTAAIGAEAILKIRFPYVEQQGVNRAVTVHWFDVVRAVETALSQPVAAPQAEDADANCERCQGNGEIVTDWKRYLHAHDGDVGDEAVTDCPDCDGTGHVDLSTPPQPEGGADRLVTALTKVMPIRVQNGPDYAEVYFSDGSTHSTQAMTMNPDDWTAINEAFAALQPEKTNGQ